MQQFSADFDQACNRLRRHGITICNDLLGLKLLIAANLSNHHEQLIKATITKVSYKLIFSNDRKKQNIMGHETNIKMELNFCTKKAPVMKMDTKKKAGMILLKPIALLTNLEKPANVRFKDSFTKIKSTQGKTIHQKHQPTGEIRHNQKTQQKTEIQRGMENQPTAKSSPIGPHNSDVKM